MTRHGRSRAAAPAGRVRRCGAALGPLVAACCLATAVAPLSAAQRDRIARRVALDATKVVEIRSTFGMIRVIGEDRADLQVDIEREVADNTVADALPVRVDEDGDAVRISALQSAGGRVETLRAAITVALPRTTALRAIELAGGDLDITGTRGALHAVVGRGAITARDVAGIVRLETTDGDLSVGVSDLSRGLVRLRSVSGNISIDLARRPTDARILLHSLAGAIDSTLPLEARQGFGGRLREGVIGAGQVLMSADTVRGAIRLRVEP